MSVFYFAWVDFTTGGVPAFGPEHQVEDEEIVRFSVEQTEGDFAMLSIDIRNPRVGLLAPGRPLWAFLSYDTGTAGVKPLFFGRLIGSPTNLIAEVVTLSLVAKPFDFIPQKYDLALNTLAILPYYDPIFIDPQKRPGLQTGTASVFVGDADVVLEGYSKLWHTDRITHELTVSDLIAAEDGTEIFTADEVPYDSVQIEIGSPPLTSVKVIGSVNWSQSNTGIIDFGERWFDTMTGGSVVSGWPQKGSGLAGGWSVYDSFAIDVYNVNGQQTVQKQFNFENREKTHNVGDPMSMSESYTLFPVGGQMFISDLKRQAGVVPSAAVIAYDSAGVPFDPYAAIATEGDTEKAIPLHMSYNQTMVANWKVHTMLQLQYDAGDKRLETAKFNMVADLQQIVTLPDPSEVEETIELNGTDVGLDIAGTPPIGTVDRNTYFDTDRGKQSVEYLLNVARAHLLHRARAVSVTWNCRFDRAIDLTLRKNASIADGRIPGGGATGKITHYVISADGTTGELKGNVTISCAIGRDGTIAAAPGDPDYVQTGYVATGYQTVSGAITSLGDVGYSVPPGNPTGLFYPLTKEQVVVAEYIDSSQATDPVQVGSDTDAHGNTFKTFATFPVTSYYLELKPITGNEFPADYDVTVTVLKVPKLIDLEAASTS